MQHNEKSTESNACASDKLAKTTTIEIIDIDSGGDGEEDAGCEVSSSMKTNAQCKKQLKTVFKLKAEKEYLLKKV